MRLDDFSFSVSANNKLNNNKIVNYVFGTFFVCNKLNETLHRRNITGIHDYNLRILRDSQRLGVAIVATILLIATVIANVSSFIVNFKRYLYFLSQITSYHFQKLIINFFMIPLFRTKEYSTNISGLFIIIGLQ